MTLFEHQITGANWLASAPRGRRYLADAPGLGKTQTAVTALGHVASKTPLVVCPAIVRSHWAREFQALGYDPSLSVVKSYDEIVRGGFPLMKDLIQSEKIDALVLDEAHLVKHATSKRTNLLLGPNGYARRLEHVFPLSGTPIPKNPVEFWTTLSSLFPEVALEHGLKTRQDMIDRFAVTRGGYVRGAWREKILPVIRNEDEFKEILSKVMLRRTLDDVGLDVPKIFWQTVRLDGASTVGDDAFADGYAAKDIIAALGDGGGVHAPTLEEIANDPHVARMRRRLGELKAPIVAAMLATELDEGDEKVVVFAHHREVLGQLQMRLAKFGVAYLDGSTPQSKRDSEIDRFATDPNCRVFVAQNLAAGTGTDGLQHSGARRLVLVEPDWTADNNLQLGKRLARIGQRSERVVGQMIALAGTLDEAIVGQNLQEVRMAESIGLGEK